MPDFGLDQWQSNIRQHVSSHPDYEGIQAWGGIETSDITYADVQGGLTRLLIETGHLDEDWRDRRPYYYLEVKSTPGPARAPFFMSHGQYKRVSDSSRFSLSSHQQLSSCFFAVRC